MDTLYLICAIAGGTLIVCQFLMTLLGLGGDHELGGHGDSFLDGGHDLSGGHEVGHGAEPTWYFSMLTLRALSAALAFFGLTGSFASIRFDPPAAFGLALLGGFLALFLVAWLMRFLSRLNVDGTARIERSLGSRGTVYLSIPGNRAGTGKVHVSLQNRTMEYKAVTSREDLPTGSKVVIVAVINGDTVEVAPLENIERTNHG